MRAGLVILGLVLAVGAGIETRAVSARGMVEELSRDEGSAYRWCDVGESLLKDGRIEEARYCFRRALELAPGIPQIRVRDSNFHVRIDEEKEGLRSAAKVLEIVPDYDEVLFSYFDNVRDVLAEVGGNRRVARAYLEHLMKAGNTVGAETVWANLQARDFTDEKLVKSYIEFLVRNRLYEHARQAWVAHLGSRRGDYPDRNLIYNGGFESEPTGALFDWRIEPSEVVETRRDTEVSKSGQASLKVQFHGTQNVAYENARQTFYVTGPGQYSLTAWVRTADITTNEGLRVRLYDVESPSRLDIRTEQMSGTHDWLLLNQEFTVNPATHLVAVSLLRNASSKFDSKINGTAWVDEVSVLTR